MPAGSFVRIHGPFGSTILSESGKRVIFIAGGVGVTPFLSMMRDVNERRIGYKISLIYSNIKEEDVSYRKEIEDIARTNKNINIFFIRSERQNTTALAVNE